jgi:serine/threonine protein phosphatase PrpC
LKAFINKYIKQSNRLQNDLKSWTEAKQGIYRQQVNTTYPILIPKLSVGSAQSIGKQRDHNEDTLFTFTSVLTKDSASKIFSLFAVADGMGGHQYGEIASRLAVQTLSSFIIKNLYLPVFSQTIELDEINPSELLKQAFFQANQTVVENAPGGGTTLSVVLILDQLLVICHVGDSRIYYINKSDDVKILTRDHSLVNRLIELGQITHEQAAVHPQRNVIYRALGQGEPFEPEFHAITTPDIGYLLICSDGLWGSVSKRKIYDIIINETGIQNASERLIDAANGAGGSDNSSVILVRFSS